MVFAAMDVPDPDLHPGWFQKQACPLLAMIQANSPVMGLSQISPVQPIARASSNFPPPTRFRPSFSDAASGQIRPSTTQMGLSQISPVQPIARASSNFPPPTRFRPSFSDAASGQIRPSTTQVQQIRPLPVLFF
ncbi:uncharacterized protein [Lolium perenne]|uniref:uncharacterized protein n=1 Tax=Lolium perenne TaxID=4522 RepID=UPI003A98E9FA